jgi:hypothetical protein
MRFVGSMPMREFLTLLRGEAMHTLLRPLAEQLELAEA